MSTKKLILWTLLFGAVSLMGPFAILMPLVIRHHERSYLCLVLEKKMSVNKMLWITFLCSFVLGPLAYLVPIIIWTVGKRRAKKGLKNQVKIFEKHFELIMDVITEFLGVYSKISPEEWYHLFISQRIERENYGSTIVQRGYLEFQILLGYWNDAMLRPYPEIEDNIKSMFVYDADKQALTYSGIMTRTVENGIFPSEEVNKILQSCLDNYEKKHPEWVFERHGWGAAIHHNV